MSEPSGHLPAKEVMCHRTGFAKSCRECVVDHGCRLWKPLRLDVDKSTGKTFIEHWDCVDAHAHTLAINLLGRQDTTTASVDNLRKEVQQANDVGLSSVLVGINSQVRRLADAQDVAQIATTQTKLLEAN
jgi:anti-anti-sigma regulatory factor